MDYEKKYKEALKRAKAIIEVASNQDEAISFVNTIFPELRESEGEKIRKEIISVLKNANYKGVYDKHLAWLEKQGEQKETICDKCKKAQPSQSCQDITALGRCYIDGMNKSNKVEPKFKVGDWIITPGNKVLQITSIEGTSYRFNNESHYWEICYCDEQCRLWTIQDAKDGDVLDANGAPFIYKRHDKDYVYFYCGVNLGDAFIEANGIDTWNNNNKVYPATKEQRELLFSKMKEAGYEWDAEQKKLGKRVIIDEGKAEMDYCFTKMMNGEKVSSDWGEDDEIEFNHILKTLTSVAKEQEIKGYNNLTSSINWLKTLKDRVQPQPKQEWSEEDEIGLSDALWCCEQATSIAKDENDMGNAWYAERWLKSLKERLHPQWKPSEEQIDVLNMVITDEAMDDNVKTILKELIIQIKKL